MYKIFLLIGDVFGAIFFAILYSYFYIVDFFHVLIKEKRVISFEEVLDRTHDLRSKNNTKNY